MADVSGGDAIKDLLMDRAERDAIKDLLMDRAEGDAKCGVDAIGRVKQKLRG